MLEIFNLLKKNIIFILIIILVCKNKISYNEELILWLVYFSLFFIIITMMYAFLMNYLLNISFSLIEFYDLLLILKTSLLNNILSLFNILKNNNFVNLLLYQIYFLVSAKTLAFKSDKRKSDFFFFVLQIIGKNVSI